MLVSLDLNRTTTVLVRKVPKKKIGQLRYDPCNNCFRDNFFDSCSTQSASCDSCSLEEFDPICVNGKYTFFTPCHGGCNSRNVSAITDCTCLSFDSNDVTTNPQNMTVAAGSCPFRAVFNSKSCSKHSLKICLKTSKSEKCSFGVYAAFLYFTMFFTFVNGIPATNSILRVVPPELRSQAMGINIGIFLHAGISA